MANLTYDEAVQWMRTQPHYSEVVKDCYLDEDNLVAAQRFTQSEEFLAAGQLLDLQPSSHPLKILDVGCGNGIASFAFASLGHVVSAIDPNPSSDLGLGAVQRLAAHFKSGSIATAQATAESIPFPDGTFDIVYARQSLHHFSDLNRGLRECARVLKPGGRFLAVREHVVDDAAQLQVFLAEHTLHHLHGGENAHSVPTYLAALQQAGFKVLRNFAHFETVINHYPMTNAEMHAWIEKVLAQKVGPTLAPFLAKLPFLESQFRTRLSRGCETPGRFHSFLCLRP